VVRTLQDDGAGVRAGSGGTGAEHAALNTEVEQSTAAHFNIRSIPTLVLFKNGREVARQPGAMGAADIVRWVKANN
jgi:thioredoxin 2